MKTLLILRHAKAQSDAPRGDWERRLTGRGERDARAVGEIIRSLDAPPDVIVTSDARRSHRTAELVAEVLGSTPPLAVEPGIYGADVSSLRRVVCDLPNDADCALMVGHNPGFEDLAAELAEPGRDVDRLRTAGLAHLEFDVAVWRDTRPGAGHLRGLYTGRGHKS